MGFLSEFRNLGFLSPGILSSGILSVGILSAGFLSCVGFCHGFRVIIWQYILLESSPWRTLERREWSPILPNQDLVYEMFDLKCL